MTDTVFVAQGTLMCQERVESEVFGTIWTDHQIVPTDGYDSYDEAIEGCRAGNPYGFYRFVVLIEEA